LRRLTGILPFKVLSEEMPLFNGDFETVPGEVERRNG
jgi:hypothetical protein